MPQSVIYEPRGAAREYAELATNLYLRCPYSCRYCYVPDAIFKPPVEYHLPAMRRAGYQRALERDAGQLIAQYIGRERPRVHMSFIGDPYQPVEELYQETRRAIQTLHKYGWPVQILTKSATLPERDFPLLTERDRFGVTVTSLHPVRIAQWEPQAPAPAGRLKLLAKAKAAGIGTWVSLEPLFRFDDTLAIIAELGRIRPDFVWVGKLNHCPDWQPDVLWPELRERVVETLKADGLKFGIKDALAEAQ
jgi:DNA repair photolyase